MFALWEMADCLAHETCEILLVGHESAERMHALVLGIVRSHFLMEVKLRKRVAMPRALLYDCDRGVIATRLDGERHQLASWKAFGTRPTPKAYGSIRRDGTTPHMRCQ